MLDFSASELVIEEWTSRVISYLGWCWVMQLTDGQWQAVIRCQGHFCLKREKVEPEGRPEIDTLPPPNRWIESSVDGDACRCEWKPLSEPSDDSAVTSDHCHQNTCQTNTSADICHAQQLSGGKVCCKFTPDVCSCWRQDERSDSEALLSPISLLFIILW